MFKPISFVKPINLPRESIAKLRDSKAYMLKKYRLVSRFNRSGFLDRFLQWCNKFNSSQWCYFIAIGFLIGSEIFSTLTSSHIKVVAFIAFLGLFREMWRMFQRVWDHNFGKAFVLILYASTANFALAFAAIKINLVTGVEPMPFIFTLGFTTLVMLPFWLTLSNILFLLIGLILANLLLLVSLPCRVLGVRLSVHWEDKHRAGTTMILRTVLIPIVIYGLLSLTAPYFHQFDLIDSIETPKTFHFSTLTDEVSLNQQKKQDEEITEAMQKIKDATEDGELGNVFKINFGNNADDIQTAQEKTNGVYRLIADFVYYFESYKHSICKKDDAQHSVILDDFSVLFITPDDAAEYGYRFQVSKCVPIYELGAVDQSTLPSK